MRWKKITQNLYKRWGNDEKGFRDFVATFGFDRYSLGSPCVSGSVGDFLRCEKGADRKPRYTHTGALRRVPFFPDHSILFHKAGTTRRMWVYHPYPYALTADDWQKLKDWCCKQGVVCVIYSQSKSFYYPGHTYMVMLMSWETYMDCLSIPGFLQKFEEEATPNETTPK